MMKSRGDTASSEPADCMLTLPAELLTDLCQTVTTNAKQSLLSHKTHRVALISVKLAFSQTAVYTARSLI